MIELPPKPHIYKPYRPLDPPRASADDLAQPSQWVRVRNTSPAQTHIVIDRYKGGCAALAENSNRLFSNLASRLYIPP